MVEIQPVNFFDTVQFVVVKHFHIKTIKQVEVDFVAVIANGHNEVSFCIKPLDLVFPVEREKIENCLLHAPI